MGGRRSRVSFNKGEKGIDMERAEGVWGSGGGGGGGVRREGRRFFYRRHQEGGP